MDTLLIIPLIFVLVLVVMGIMFAIFFTIYAKKARRHAIFEHQGHKIEIITRFFGAKLVVDDKTIDEGSRYNNYHFDFIHKIGKDTIKVYITRKVLSPEIKVFINDEKKDIEY